MNNNITFSGFSKLLEETKKLDLFKNSHEKEDDKICMTIPLRF